MLTTVSDVTDVSCNFQPSNICDYIPGSCWKLYPVTYPDYGKPCSYSSLHVLHSLLTPVSIAVRDRERERVLWRVRVSLLISV